jgi:hypothetical protein
MSIKNRGEKYVDILNFLRREYVKKFGKEAEGLSDTMLKRQAAEQVDEMSKVVPFPEKNITDWTKDRPKTGPKADVKTFPKQKKLTPEPKTSIERLEKELEEMEKLGQPYKDTSVSDFMSDYFDMPKKSKTPATDKMQKMLGDVKLYGDETFDELQIIKDTGKHPRDKKANGGRIGYSTGKRAKGIKSLMEKLNEKLSKKKNKGKVEIADDAPVSEKTKLQREFDEFNKRFKEKTKSYKQGDPITSENFGETPFAPDTTGLNKAREMYDDIVKFRTENPAGKGRFTKAEVIITRLENTIQGAKNNPDETSDYVLTNFPNMIEELKNKPDLANNENVFQRLAVEGLPKNQRLKVYDDGTVDFETLKPTHQFKLKEDIKRKLNAEGGLNYLMGL